MHLPVLMEEERQRMHGMIIDVTTKNIFDIELMLLNIAYNLCDVSVTSNSLD